MKRIIAVMLCVLSVVLCLASCGKDAEPEETTAPAAETGGATLDKSDAVKVEMSVHNFGTVTLALYPHIAPVTVENFVNLVNDKFYDGLTFHRIMAGFMIQSGDPNGDGTGGSAKTIFGEFAANGYNNPLSHKRGVISMARRSDNMNSASSQFFICHADASYSLDGMYASFGEVIDGMDVIDKIASVEVAPNPYSGEMSVPVETVYIDYIKVVD